MPLIFHQTVSVTNDYFQVGKGHNFEYRDHTHAQKSWDFSSEMFVVRRLLGVQNQKVE